MPDTPHESIMNGEIIEVTLSAVAYQEGDTWSAQCLEFDIAAQAKSLTDLHYELQRVITAHIVVCQELGREPFSGLEPAPPRFWKLFEAAKLRVEGERTPFRLPRLSSVRPILPFMKIADACFA